MTSLDLVDTIVLVMLENRSFDHMLGHLSYGQYSNGSDVDGLTEPLERDDYVNIFEGEAYYPYEMDDGDLSTDLPHDRGAIAAQLNKSAVTGTFAMDGFVKSYFEASPTNRPTEPDPLGFLGPHDVPMTRFFADHYAVCDRWFSSLPAGTQPNRLMAWTGTSLIDTNGLNPPRDELVIRWLERNNVPWRVYTSGLSLFLLFGSIEPFGPNFRGIDRLAADVANEQRGDFPQVIIVEPSYGDTARITGAIANDDHAPLGVGPGEIFLRRVYEALTRNPTRWARTVMIVTFDEHGGFYDHVPPPLISFPPPSEATYSKGFESLGVRVPGLVVSPLVSAKSVCHEVLDHTSILQFLAEKFTPGTPYSAAVDARRESGVNSVSVALDLEVPRAEIPPAPSFTVLLAVPLGMNTAPLTPLEVTFEEAAFEMVRNNPKLTAQKYPEVTHWVLSQKNSPHA